MKKSQKLPCGRDRAECGPRGPTKKDKELIVARLNDYVSSKGLNRSAVRDDVIKTILTFEGHFAIGDLVREVQRSSPQIGTATVYRQIPVFLESKVLKESFLSQSGQPLYEVNLDDHHDHLVCVDCGAVFEFHEGKIETAQESLTSKMKFASAGHTHVLYGHCKLLRLRDFQTPKMAQERSAVKEPR